MTRSERLAKAEALARTQLEAQRNRLAKVRSQQREEERRETQKRRVLVGQLVENAGLFVLDDTTLAHLLACLTPLASVPDPVPMLQAALAGILRPALTSVDGMAQAPQTAPGAAPTVPLG